MPKLYIPPELSRRVHTALIRRLEIFMAAASSEALTSGAVNPMGSAPEGNTARPGT